MERHRVPGDFDATAWLRRRAFLLGAGASALLSPVAYLALADGSVTAAVLASSGLGYAAALGVAVHFDPPTQYLTRKRRLEALGGRAVMAFFAYVPVGFVVLALISLLAPPDFPVFTERVVRYVIIWPFYVWYVLFCSIKGLPCPPGPAAA